MSLKKSTLLPLLICVSLITASCGSASQNDSEIATAVAQTVQAQSSPTEVSALPTLTPAPALEATSTPELESTNTPAAVAANPGCVASAELIGENPPDNILLKPGETFWKTWTLLNTGTCTWDLSYKLVYWSGDLLGGLTSYQLPDVVAPNESKEISILLKTPDTDGTFTGYWRLQTPWGQDFGVGPTSESFYVQIGVSSSSEPAYGITNISYQLVRDPEAGCPLNVRYTVIATVSTSGPFEFSYYWDQSDGNESSPKSYKMKEAGSVTFKRDWLISKNDSPNPRWIQFIVTEPKYLDYGRVDILHNCFGQ